MNTPCSNTQTHSRRAADLAVHVAKLPASGGEHVGSHSLPVPGPQVNSSLLIDPFKTLTSLNRDSLTVGWLQGREKTGHTRSSLRQQMLQQAAGHNLGSPSHSG